MFKVNNKNTRDVIIGIIEHISHHFLVFLLLILNFEQVNVSWVLLMHLRTRRGVNFNRFIKNGLVITSNNCFFVTCYFGDTHCLMYEDKNQFVVNCQFFPNNTVITCDVKLKTVMLYHMSNTFLNAIFSIYVALSLMTCQLSCKLQIVIKH